GTQARATTALLTTVPTTTLPTTALPATLLPPTLLTTPTAPLTRAGTDAGPARSPAAAKPKVATTAGAGAGARGRGRSARPARVSPAGAPPSQPASTCWSRSAP